MVNVWHGPGGETGGVTSKAMGKSGLFTRFHHPSDRVSRAISSSNLTFSLSDGLAIVETEDWRIRRVIGPGVVRMGVSRRTFLSSFVF